MKKQVSGILALALSLLLSLALPVLAEAPAAPPVVVLDDGSAQVPLSFLKDGLNVRYAYNSYTDAVTLVNGNGYRTLATTMIDETPYLSLSEIAGELGIELTYDAETGSVDANGFEALPNENMTIILQTTTSTQDSGLLDYLLPIFKEEMGYDVMVVSVGTGQALKNSEAGDGDVVLVHSRAAEDAFMEAGFGLDRKDVMYNDFILVGGEGDPAGVKANYSADIKGALAAIHETGAGFVSRGDDSGTDKLEKAFWKGLDIDPATNKEYRAIGKGMGDVLMMTDELQCYTIADRGTYLSMKDKLQLAILCENDPTGAMFNPYGVIVINPENAQENASQINLAGAIDFSNWITSPEVQELISQYGVEAYGAPLFVPSAK